jgi:hypothetical protein
VELPSPAQAVIDFVRDRLGETLAPLRTRADRMEAGSLAAARQLAVVVVGAAAPLAANSYARARLLRQLHATGLLSEREREVLGVAP